MANIDFRPPQFDGGLDEKENVKKLGEYLYNLSEQLRYILSNLDEGNLSTALVNKISDAASGVESIREQTAEGFSQTVRKNGVISAINQSPEMVQIQAEKIKLEGYTTINGNFAVDESGNVRLTGADFELSDEKTYYSEDYSAEEFDRLHRLELGLLAPVLEDMSRLDLNQDGVIDGKDFLILHKFMENVTPSITQRWLCSLKASQDGILRVGVGLLGATEAFALTPGGIRTLNAFMNATYKKVPGRTNDFLQQPFILTGRAYGVKSTAATQVQFVDRYGRTVTFGDRPLPVVICQIEADTTSAADVGTVKVSDVATTGFKMRLSGSDTAGRTVSWVAFGFAGLL